MKRIAMINIKTILRLRHDLKLSRDDVVAASGVSAGTVSNVLERAAAAGLACWPLPDDLDDGAPHESGYTRVKDLAYSPSVGELPHCRVTAHSASGPA